MWNFKTKNDDFIYIENISKTKFLGTTSDGQVILEDFEENKAEQLWKKGMPNAEGYFTLTPGLKAFYDQGFPNTTNYSASNILIVLPDLKKTVGIFSMQDYNIEKLIKMHYSMSCWENFDPKIPSGQGRS